MDLKELTDKYELTKDYEPKDTDIVLNWDGYTCIYEAENIGNIIFIATEEKHEYSLLDDVRFFTKTLIRYGVRVVTIRNKKWKSVLNKIDCLSLEYENKEYCIYVRKDL